MITKHLDDAAAHLDEDASPLTVGQVSERFDITIRTLHHYDEIGLLSPSERSRAGYRLYTAADVERLGAIVVYRRLGFGLDQIAELLSEPSELTEHLQRQRIAIISRLDELNELVHAIDHALETAMAEKKMTTQELKDLFGNGFSDDYQAEAEQRWGDTDAWRQGQERTSRYTRADWEEVKKETDAVNAAFVEALASGEPATSERAMDAAEAHRLSIHNRYYDLDHAFHRNLGEMYVGDPRFTTYYDDLAPGLAQYVRDAIVANAERHGVSA